MCYLGYFVTSPKIGGNHGAWSDYNTYVSIVGGVKSHGGMPYKLRTKNESIPISKGDAEKLQKNKKIKPL